MVRAISLAPISLARRAARKKEEHSSRPIMVPTGNEPWGNDTRWRALDAPLKEASVFVSEMGITRAAAAFENYLTDAKSEFDRAKLTAVLPKKDGRSALHGFDAILGVNTENMQALIAMAEFFDAARNCVVHRSNCASAQPEELREAPATIAALEKWPPAKIELGSNSPPH